MSTVSNQVPNSNVFIKMSIAGTSCACISTILNPIDVTKAAMKILRDEGIMGWCRGIPATIYRELSYSSIRIGAYEPIRSKLCELTQSNSSPLVKYSSALITGFIGSFAANPFDLVKTKFQAIIPNTITNSAAAKELSIGTWTALHYIFKSEGLIGLYKGWQLTTLRAAVLTSAQLGSYDSIKNNIFIDMLKYENGLVVHFWVSLLAGIITTTAANPGYLADTDRNYSGPWQCTVNLVKSEGLYGFVKGWTAAYLRIGPHTILSFILIEKIRSIFGLPPI